MNFGSPFINLKAQELIASGIPSLDAILGGGIPKGALVLLNEDTIGVYSDLFLKVFFAQGIVKKDDILFATREVSSNAFMNTLPQEANNNVGQAKNVPCNEPLQIAWRYENNIVTHTSLEPTTTSFSSSFHFKDALAESLVQSANIYSWPYEDSPETYDDLIEFIRTKLIANNHLNEQASKKVDKTVLRIGIHHLGSFFWKQPQNKLPYFLYKLRALLHHSHAVTLIVFPKFLIQEPEIVSRCEQMCDFVMELECFGADTNPLYSELNGFIKFNKVAALNSLCPLMKDSKDWAFKFNLKKLIVEKMRLPPENESSGQREQDVTTSSYCVQTSNKLDF